MSKMAGLADRIARTKKNDDDQADKLSRAASIVKVTSEGSQTAEIVLSPACKRAEGAAAFRCAKWKSPGGRLNSHWGPAASTIADG